MKALTYLAPLTALIIITSPTIAGWAFRAAVMVPLYWMGLVDAETVDTIVLHGHW